MKPWRWWLVIACVVAIGWLLFRFIVPYINRIYLSPVEAMVAAAVLMVVAMVLVNSHRS